MSFRELRSRSARSRCSGRCGSATARCDPPPRQEAFLLLSDVEVFFGGAAGGGKSGRAADGRAAVRRRPRLPRPAPAAEPDRAAARGRADRALPRLARRHQGALDGRDKDLALPRPRPHRRRRRNARASATSPTPAMSRRYAGSSYSLPRLRRAHPLRRTPLPAHVPRAAPANHRHRARRRPRRHHASRTCPLRVRATSNPGGPGHRGSRTASSTPPPATPASSSCPPGSPTTRTSTTTTYLDTLAQLPTAERERLLHGDWEIPDDGELFQRDWFTTHRTPPAPRPEHHARCATGTSPPPNPQPRQPRPRLDRRAPPRATTDASGNFYITDIVRTPGPAGDVRINPAPPGSSAFHIAAASTSVALVKLLADKELIRTSSGKTVTPRFRCL